MPKKKVEAGSEIDSYCTKCKIDLNHRIIAMDGDAPKRVECLTCRGHHNYRVPRAELEKAKKKKKKKTTTRKTTRKSVAATKAAAFKAEEERRAAWEDATTGRGADDFTGYSIAGLFEPGQLLRHKKFGDGVVAEIVEGGKMQVLFEDGPRMLVYGR